MEWAAFQAPAAQSRTHCSRCSIPRQQPQCDVMLAVKRRNTWHTTWESEVVLPKIARPPPPPCRTILTFTAFCTSPFWPLSPPFTFYPVDSPEDWMCSFQRPHIKIVPYTWLSWRQWRVVRNAGPSDMCGLACVSFFWNTLLLRCCICHLLKKFSKT